MQGASWITLLRRIPVNLHDGLVLTLVTGGEVVVQRFVKLDSDVVILRGRMAGTQDSGRVVIVPYNYLVAINFTRRLSEKDILAIFGKNTQSFAAEMVLVAGSADETKGNEDGDEAPEDQAAAGGAAESASAAAKPALPSKADLLAKLRARLNDPAR